MCCLHIHRYRTINWSMPGATPLKKGKPAFPPLHSKGSGLQNISFIPDRRWNSCILCRSHNFSEGFVHQSFNAQKSLLHFALASEILLSSLLRVCIYVHMCVPFSHVCVCMWRPEDNCGCHSSGSLIRLELTRLGWSESHRNWPISAS